MENIKLPEMGEMYPEGFCEGCPSEKDCPDRNKELNRPNYRRGDIPSASTASHIVNDLVRHVLGNEEAPRHTSEEIDVEIGKLAQKYDESPGNQRFITDYISSLQNNQPTKVFRLDVHNKKVGTGFLIMVFPANAEITLENVKETEPFKAFNERANPSDKDVELFNLKELSGDEIMSHIKASL